MGDKRTKTRRVAGVKMKDKRIKAWKEFGFSDELIESMLNFGKGWLFVDDT